MGRGGKSKVYQFNPDKRRLKTFYKDIQQPEEEEEEE